MPDKRYALDPVHVGIRLAVGAVLFGVAALAAIVILPSVSATAGLTGLVNVFFVTGGTLGLSAVSAYSTERLLRSVWPSGRWLSIGKSVISIQERGAPERIIRRSDPVDILAWYFVIQHNRAWVQKGWFCLACRIAQEDTDFAIFTFMTPERAQALPQWNAFEHLVSLKARTAKPNETSDQPLLRLAEQSRWESGLEMYPPDFAEFVATIHADMAH